MRYFHAFQVPSPRVSLTNRHRPVGRCPPSQRQAVELAYTDLQSQGVTLVKKKRVSWWKCVFNLHVEYIAVLCILYCWFYRFVHNCHIHLKTAQCIICLYHQISTQFEAFWQFHSKPVRGHAKST